MGALTACSLSEKLDEYTGTQKNRESEKAEEVSVSKQTELSKEEEERRLQIGMTKEALDELSKRQEGLFYYGKLSDSEKELYTEILFLLQKMESDVVVSTLSEQEIATAFQAVMSDHPEIFYVEGYSFSSHLYDGELRCISFAGNYTMSLQEKEELRIQIEEKVAHILENCPNGEDYLVVKYLYEYLIQNTDYYLEALHSQDICSVFLYGESVCQGYAKAFQYLCRQCDLECILVYGTVKNNAVSHSWNMVRADGAYYYVDTTWGDPSYQGTEQQLTGLPEVNYDFLCITTQMLERTHVTDAEYVLPYCVETVDNYHVRERAFFTEYDEALLARLFGRQQDYITLRCDNEATYQRMYDELIGQSKVFDYMSGRSGISYSDNADSLTLAFWLPVE